MTDIRRPLSLQVSLATSTFSASSTSSSSSSSSSSLSSSGYESPSDTPSLILPYLYVGDQNQTQIDTISNLNIRYILSLQSLPKFLDSEENSVPNGEIEKNVQDQHGKKKIKSHHDDEKIKIISNERQYDDESLKTGTQPSEATIDEVEVAAQNSDNDGDDKRKQVLDPKGLLPSVNSSKNYLVKFRSCVHRLIKGKCINISDTFEQLVDKFFDETHNFIEEARRNKCNILIHCKAGISRSPTIAIAYLMKWKRLHLQDAYDFVKRCRPQISPNLNFMGQLMSYERKLLQRVDRQFPSPTLCYLPSPKKVTIDDLSSPDNEESKYLPDTIHIAA